MDDHQIKQQILNRQIQSYIPEIVWDSTIAIVIVHENEVHQFGTGILFRIADRSFLISAAHIFTKAHEFQKTIGITASDDNLIALGGNAICSAEGQYGTSGDPFDIAIYPLSDDDINRLSGKSFLRLNDIDFSEQSQTGVYSIFGYPAIWSKSTSTTSGELKLKALEYTTFTYDHYSDNFAEFKKNFHILLEARDDYLTLSDGSKTELRMLDGQNANFPGDLGGISGCSVWRIGDLKIPIDKWGQTASKNIAVQTSVYPRKMAIKATRWGAVLTLISKAFPELQPAIEIWRP